MYIKSSLCYRFYLFENKIELCPIFFLFQALPSPPLEPWGPEGGRPKPSRIHSWDEEASPEKPKQTWDATAGPALKLTGKSGQQWGLSQVTLSSFPSQIALKLRNASSAAWEAQECNLINLPTGRPGLPNPVGKEVWSLVPGLSWGHRAAGLLGYWKSRVKYLLKKKKKKNSSNSERRGGWNPSWFCSGKSAHVIRQDEMWWFGISGNSILGF